MTHILFSRASASALLLGGLLGGGGYLLHPNGDADPLNAPIHLALFFAIQLIVLGLPGFLARQGGKGAGLTLLGGGLFGLGLTLDLLHAIPEFTTYEAFRADPALRALLVAESPFQQALNDATLPTVVATILTGALALGFPLLGAAIIRAGVLPRWVGWAFMGCLVPILAASFVPALVGWDHLGSILASPLYFGPALLGAIFLRSLRAEQASTRTAFPTAAPVLGD